MIAPRVSEAFTLIELLRWGFGPSAILTGEIATLGAHNFGDGSVTVELTIVDSASGKVLASNPRLFLTPGMGGSISFQMPAAASRIRERRMEYVNACNTPVLTGVGPDQAGFIDFFERELRPRLD